MEMAKVEFSMETQDGMKMEVSKEIPADEAKMLMMTIKCSMMDKDSMVMNMGIGPKESKESKEPKKDGMGKGGHK